MANTSGESPLQYKNIIFDLGGVIIDIDPARVIHSFSALGSLSPKASHKLFEEHPLFREMEKGNISEKTFRADLRKLLGNEHLTDTALDEVWCAMLLQIPAQRIEVLVSLASKHNLYLLSNTNVIHIRRVEEILLRDTGQLSLAALFKKVYYSHNMGLRKPDPQIYLELLADAGIDPKDTTFLDDGPSNVEGAEKVGIKSFHVDSPDRIFDLLAYEKSS